MTGRWWLDAAIGAAAALLVCWLLLIAVLLRGKRRHGATGTEALRLLPDLIRLLRRVASDRSLPVGVRVRIWGLVAYLASPIDLVPDFIPMIGFADDAIITVLVLRSVVRRIGLDGLRGHWPGTEQGFQALSELAGMSHKPSGTPSHRR
ncbi:YkvA family protein [Microlunatus ginsengisoli]|uniref:DUF1232 domain-containing protein n=1 Tax=Microlunatus ginsengisoli TaxID=363863 RepID=A0ABP7AQ83_9ACTN